MASNYLLTSTDDPKISQHYKTGATEQPSSLIDQQILQQAKAAVPEIEGATNSTQHVQAKAWHKWQWSGSIAASLLLVSLLYVFNQPYYRAIDLAPEDLYVESVVANKRQVDQAKKAAKTQAAQSLPTTLLANPVDNYAADFVSQDSEEHIQDEARSQSLMTDQVMSLAVREKELAKNNANRRQRHTLPSEPQNMPALSESAAEIDEFTDEQALSFETPAETPSSDLEMIVVTGSRLSSETDKSSIDYKHLDSLLQKLQSSRQNLAAEQPDSTLNKNFASLQQNERLENKDSEDWKQVQAELYEILLEHKQLEPKLLLPEKYLNVLSQEQLGKLLALSIQQ
ncbi:MAG: hypothetical protein ACI808_000901 [Paraglaciecola sp.]|jgi:hypothetical protein